MKFTFLIFFLFAFSAGAKEVSILFIGNSYTYLPGQGRADDPALPKLIQAIAKSIDPSFVLKVSSHTPGSYSFERHFKDPISNKLMSDHYDKVVLQGNSIESLELTPERQKKTIGLQSFQVYLPKVLELVFKKNDDVNLYVNWGWSQKNPALQPSAKGLYFPPGNPRAGEKWCGKDKFDYQKMIDASYALHSKDFPVHLALVGDAWLELQRQGLVKEEDLYIAGDWSHPSLLGGFVAALVLTRDVLKLDIAKNKFWPEGIKASQAQAFAKALANKTP